MPYNRDEVVASITAYYTFLTTHLHFDPSELRTPPPNGWPNIDPSRFAFLSKSDKVIDLLRHLPYLPADEEKHIYEHVLCADYAGKAGDSAVKYGNRSDFGPDNPLTEDDSPWEVYEDIAVLGIPAVSDNGNYILLDVATGRVIVWDVIVGHWDVYESAGECFEQLRKDFEELRVFTDCFMKVHVLTQGREQDMRDAIRSFGWPPAQGDGCGWKREEYFEEAERLFDEYFYVPAG